MQKAAAIKEKAGTVYNIDKDTYEGVDLTEFSDEELAALGIDPSEVERPEEDEEEELDEEENEDEDGEDDESDGDDENEGDEGDDEGDEAKDDDENEEEEKDIRIPKSRFDEAVGKEREKVRAAEERAQWLEQQIQKLIDLQANKNTETVAKAEEESVNIDELEAQYVDKILEGEIDEAKQLRKQINQYQEKRIQVLLKETRENAKKEAEQLSEKDKFDIAVQKSVIEYEFLDTDHPDYNEDLVIDINALSKGYAESGRMSPAEALEKAVAKLAKPYKQQLSAKNKSVTKKKTTTSTRETQKAERKTKQPPNLKSGKVSSLTPDDIDWENLSEKEFDKLYKENPKLISKYLSEPQF